MVTQAAEHADEFLRVRVKFLKYLFGEKTLLSSDETLADQFVERTNSQLDEPCKVLARGTRTSLCDIGRHRHSRTPHLARDAESFIGWKLSRNVVDERSEINRSLPDIEFFKVEASFCFIRQLWILCRSTLIS